VSPKLEIDHGAWHLDKRVSLATIFTTATTVLAGAYFIISLEKNIDVVSLNVHYNAKEIERIQREMSIQQSQILDQLSTLNAKIDRIIEREMMIHKNGG